MDLYKILKVDTNCDRDAIHNAFRQLSKEFHPDRFSEAQREQAERHYQQIVKAFNILKDPKQRARYDKNRAVFGAAATPDGQVETDLQNPLELAAKYQQQGFLKYQEKEYEQAAEMLAKSVHFKENAEAYHCKGLAEAHLPKLRRESLSSFQRAIQLSPQTVKYYMSLAQVLMGFGMHTKARQVVEKGLQYAAQDEKLIALDQELNPEKYKKAGFLGGVLGNIFKK